MTVLERVREHRARKRAAVLELAVSKTFAALAMLTREQWAKVLGELGNGSRENLVALLSRYTPARNANQVIVSRRRETKRSSGRAA